MNPDREQPPPARPRPTPQQRQRARKARVRRRRGTVLLGVVAALAIGLAIVQPLAGTPRSRPGRITLTSSGRPLGGVALAPYVDRGRLAAGALRRAVLTRLPPTINRQIGQAEITDALDRDSAASQAVADGPRGGVVDVPTRPIAARIAAPIIAQKLHNNCETAALQILLATVGVNVDQLTLQAQIRRDGPLDPRGTGASQVWGDPERGFVGRPDGGGPAGGFGVYQGPVAALALRHGRRLVDLTRAAPTAVYQRVLAGHAVMAWVGLADGPYGQWRTPTGRRLHVNFNEHAIVLSGLTPSGMLQISNPLTGTREVWTEQTFETSWNRLGRRALST